MATNTTVAVEGTVGERTTRILVDTGSAVTIVREDVWNEAVDSQQLEPTTSPVIAANGEPLELQGRGDVTFRLGGIPARHPVLVASNVTQECLLGADFWNILDVSLICLEDA